MSEKISIIVVDDHPLFREGVVTTLMESGHFSVVAQAGNSEDAIMLAEKHLPILCLSMFLCRAAELRRRIKFR